MHDVEHGVSEHGQMYWRAWLNQPESYNTGSIQVQIGNRARSAEVTIRDCSRSISLDVDYRTRGEGPDKVETLMHILQEVSEVLAQRAVDLEPDGIWRFDDGEIDTAVTLGLFTIDYQRDRRGRHTLQVWANPSREDHQLVATINASPAGRNTSVYPYGS